MTMSTRVQPGVAGYCGINCYTLDGIPLGDVKVVRGSETSVELEINLPGIKVVPKAIDPDDEAHDPFKED